MPASSIADSETRSVNSFASSFSQRSFFGKLNKYELKRRFYEKLDDFKNKVLLHKEQGFIVYRARCMYSGGVVVLKGYSRESLTLQTRQRVYSEVTLLQRAQCPFILKCFDSFEDQGWWWLVLENCAAGDLYRIVQQTGPIREEGWLVSQVLLPILQTLAYLHAEGVIHRDIKPEHVLFNSEKVAKLSGFFLSWDVNRYSYPKDMVGTLDYVAPEVFVLHGPNAKQQEVTHYDYKVDIWGVGIMAYDVLVGTPPFNTDDPNTTVENILLREAEYPDFMSDDAVDFIDQCLTKDPAKRPTARQLLTHPWIRSNLDWEPPEEFEDPIPNIDFSYYRVGGQGADGLDDEDEDEDDGRRWYNPITWLRRRNSLDELLAAESDGPTGGAAGSGGGPGGSGGASRGTWRLTQSLTSLARNFIGGRSQVAPERVASSSGMGLALSTGGGGDDSEAVGANKKAFQLLPSRSMKLREDLAGVPEGDEEDPDPEGGSHLDRRPSETRAPPATGGSFIVATGGSGGVDGLDSRKGSFARPYSPPPRPVNGLAAASDGSTVAVRKTPIAGGGTRTDGEDVQALSSPRPSITKAEANVNPSLSTGTSGGSSNILASPGELLPTKSPAFLPNAAALPPAPDVSDDVTVLCSTPGGGVTPASGNTAAGCMGGNASVGEIVAPARGSGNIETTVSVVVAVPGAGTPVPRRLATGTSNAHDSATSSEMIRSGSPGSGKGSSSSMPSVSAAPPPALALPGAAAAAAESSELGRVGGSAAAASIVTGQEGDDLLQLLPAEKLQLSASEMTAAVASSSSALERPLPHLSSVVIHSAEDDTGPEPETPQATSPWLVPSNPGTQSGSSGQDLRNPRRNLTNGPRGSPMGSTGASTAASAAAAAGGGTNGATLASAAVPGGLPAAGAAPGSTCASAVSAVSPAELSGAVSASANDPPLHPVLPAGGSKTTAREREDARLLAAAMDEPAAEP